MLLSWQRFLLPEIGVFLSFLLQLHEGVVGRAVGNLCFGYCLTCPAPPPPTSLTSSPLVSTSLPILPHPGHAGLLAGVGMHQALFHLCLCTCLVFPQHILPSLFLFSPSVMSTLCHPMDCSTPGLPVHHQLRELAQIYVHRVSDAIELSHLLLSLLLLSSIFRSFRVFANEVALRIRWPKEWSFSFSRFSISRDAGFAP